MWKILIILDLDETLVYSSEKPLDRLEDFRVGEYFSYKRPYLDQFLENISKEFNVAIWTSSSKYYADTIIKQMIPKSYELEFVWDRERCTRKYDSELYNYYWIKDLKKLKKKGYMLEKVLMIDDSPEKLSRNYGNHIRVNPFIGNSDDDELVKLEKYLLSLAYVENVRMIEKRGWKNKIFMA